MDLSPSRLAGGRQHLLGYRVSGMTAGRSTITWTPGEQVSNPMGFVHGGFVGLMVDDTCGTAATSMLLDAGVGMRAYPTASMHIDFVRGIRIGGVYTSAGVVVRAGRRLTLADAVITDADGTLVARGSCTFALDLSDTELVGFSALGAATPG